jgi:hypothetical protein
LGREIVLADDREEIAGEHEMEFDLSGKELAKGIYFLEVNVDGEKMVVKIVRE